MGCSGWDMQDKCGKLRAQRCAQGAWISTGGAGMDQLPVRGAKEGKKRGEPFGWKKQKLA